MTHPSLGVSEATTLQMIVTLSLFVLLLFGHTAYCTQLLIQNAKKRELLA